MVGSLVFVECFQSIHCCCCRAGERLLLLIASQNGLRLDPVVNERFGGTVNYLRLGNEAHKVGTFLIVFFIF